MTEFGRGGADVIFKRNGLKRGSEEMALVADALDGKLTNEIVQSAVNQGLNIRGAQAAAAELRDLLDAFAHMGGLPKERFLSDYFPHLWKKVDGENIAPEAFMLRQRAERLGARSAFLEKSRSGVEGYVRGADEVLDAYFGSVSRDAFMDRPLREMSRVLSASTALSAAPSTKQFIVDLVHDVAGTNRGFEIKAGAALGGTAQGAAWILKKTKMGNTALAKALDDFAQLPESVKFSRVLGGFKQYQAVKALGLNAQTPINILSDTVPAFAELGAEFSAKGFADFMKAIGKNADPQMAQVWEQSGLKALASSRYAHGELTVGGGAGKAADLMLILVRGADIMTKGPAYFGARAKWLAKHPGDIWGANQYGLQVVERTQPLFLQSTSPAIMRTALARTMTQFTQPGLKVLSQQRRIVKEAFQSKEGMAQAFRYILAAMAASGAGAGLGIPIYKNFIAAYKDPTSEDWVPGFIKGGLNPVGQIAGGTAAMLTGSGDFSKAGKREVVRGLEELNPLRQRALQGPLSAAGLAENDTMKWLFNLRQPKKGRLNRLLQVGGINVQEP